VYARILLVLQKDPLRSPGQSKGGKMADKSRIVRLFRQKESLRRELKRTEKTLRPLNDRVSRLRRKIEIVESIDEIWNGIPVCIDVNKKMYRGCISIVDKNGHVRTVRYIYIDCSSNGRGKLRSYAITINERTGDVFWFSKAFLLGPKRISEVQAIVREWITKGTINGEDPKVK